MTTPAEQERGPWDTESGLIDDVDAVIANAHFGVKEEYSQVVVATSGGEQKGAMLLFDLKDPVSQEIIGNQGYSIGTGWEISEDGLDITHAKRKNVVTGTLYGQLQNIVVKDLGVDMVSRGLPTHAPVWEGMQFHWMLKGHATVGGAEKQGLMPTEFQGVEGEAQPEAAPAPAAAPAPVAAAKAPAKAPARAPAKPAAKGISPAEQAAIDLVAQCGTAKEFTLKAVKVPVIAADDALMSKVLDDSADGFFATHKNK